MSNVFVGYGVLALAAAATLVLVSALGPNTVTAAVLIGAWLILPHALLALALRFLAKTPAAERTYATMAVVTAVGGVLWLTYVIYLQPDAQGGIAVMFTPLYQLAGTVLLFPACDWLYRRRAS